MGAVAGGEASYGTKRVNENGDTIESNDYNKPEIPYKERKYEAEFDEDGNTIYEFIVEKGRKK